MILYLKFFFISLFVVNNSQKFYSTIVIVYYMIINKIINFIKKHKVSNDVKTLSYDYYSIVVTLTSYIHTYMYFINLLT